MIFCRSMLLIFVLQAVAVVAIPSPPLSDTGLNGTRTLHDYRASFKHKYVVRSGAIHDIRPSEASISVDATQHVSGTAHEKAALIVSLMTRHMPYDVFHGLTRSHGVGVFTTSDKLTAFPENANLADTAACHGKCSGSCSHTCTFDGRKYETLAALSNSRSVVVDHNVLCDSHDGYGHKENLLVHEFGHLTMAYMPSTWRNKIIAAYNHAKTNRLWTLNTYAMANHDEYWAEATSSFFMSILRTDVTGGMDMCGTSRPCPSEQASRSYIKHHDPQLFAALSYAYTNNNPQIASHLKPCQ
ncbi:uncharacterized protein [Haliotis asinina]|uniref:uncharacterized protein n=1 Tax=Haliotis asinina TaxID=109174 RepID=UPI00353217B1